MKCPECRANNKEGVKYCKRCGAPLFEYTGPDWKWSVKILGIIYAALIVLFIILKAVI
ncbi:MAG: zinc-ribbon domain-containing protein [Elusimicrobia bacterium]|jgi:hypothetical protein|nr:zinc-ribbon domain-containing protein [Elusimicrobiota bacterium]